MNEVLEKIVERSQPFAEADFLSDCFGKYKDAAVRGDIPLVLFGAGSAGKELYPLLKLHGVNPLCFVDNDAKRAGELFCGLPIISISDLISNHRDSLIFVTLGAYREEVKTQLIGMGFNVDKILFISGLEIMSYYTHLIQWYWPDSDLLSYEDDIARAYHLLSDYKSQEIFLSKISIFVRGSSYANFNTFIKQLSEIQPNDGSKLLEGTVNTNYDLESYLYFNNDVIHLDHNEYLIDGGAYNGDSIIQFINTCTKKMLNYKYIVGYEPDPHLFAQLNDNLSKYKNVLLRPNGLWSEPSTLTFATTDYPDRIMKPGASKLLDRDDKSYQKPDDTSGTVELKLTSIDVDLPNEPVTLIKLDIEGSESNALKGAIRTIQRCRPKLAISVYHKRNDIFEIPLLIHEIVPDYKFYLRHLSCIFEETTLFAIPPESQPFS